jgi:hypothetical protein
VNSGSSSLKFKVVEFDESSACAADGRQPTAMNSLDRFHLGMDIIDRVPMLKRSAADIRQTIEDSKWRTSHTVPADNHIPLSSGSKQVLPLSQIAPVIEL